MVHVEQVDAVHQGERPVLVDLVVLFRGLVLFDDRPEDRGDGEDDQRKYCQLNGDEKIPHLVDRRWCAFRGCDRGRFLYTNF